MEFKIASVDSIIIYFGNTISTEVSAKTRGAYELLKNSKIEGLKEIIPSYSSILVRYNLFLYDDKSICLKIRKYLLQNNKKESKSSIKRVNIPVYYGEDVGLDLQRVATLCRLDISKIIELHSNIIYRVFAIGFSAGFAYLGEVDKQIQTPRLKSPRKKVAKGSVAIADNQAAIYPSQTPGGWNIIGKTTHTMFDISQQSPCIVDIGDEIKFYSISKEEFLDSGGEI